MSTGKPFSPYWPLVFAQNKRLSKTQWKYAILDAAVSVQLLSHVQLFVTPSAIVCQAPLSMGFPTQEYLNRLPFPSPGIFPAQGLNLHLLYWQVDSFTTEPPGKPVIQDRLNQKDKIQPFVTLVLCKNNLNPNLLFLI